MKIFLSAVSGEFEACRDALASDLRAVGAEVVVQRDFQQQGQTLLEKLEAYVDGCDRVIALVGNAYGWEPDAAALPPGTPRRSYTHWEYAFARGERLDGRTLPAKDTFVYFASPEFPRPGATEQPPDHTALQQAFIAGIRAQGKDRSRFGSEFELRVLVLRDGFRLGGDSAQPELTLDLFNLTESTRFFYGAQRVPIAGRDAELKTLGDFLHTDAHFAWWLMCGPAGAGKSRTALECCLRALRDQPTWQAGWLADSDAFTEWSTWQPKAPTLIVIDDASRVAEETRQMIVALFRRRDTLAHPVRVLLLEREASGNWLERLTGSGADRHSLDASRYGNPLELHGLQAEDLWSIVHAIVEQKKDAAPVDRDRTVAALEKIDPLKRPLFASFVADALVAGRDIGQWDQKELLESVLKTDMDQQWQPAGVTEEDKNLLAVATLADELPLTVLKDPPVAGWLPTPRAYSPDRCRVMCGRSSDAVLNPLTPDILGEFFVLEHLRPSSSIDERPAALIDIALALPSTRRTTGMSYGWKRGEESERIARLRKHLYFVGRCARNFPDHPSLQQLRGPLPGPDDNFWGWCIDVANLIDELVPLPGTLDFCNQLHDSLCEVAFERPTERVDLLSYRVCTAGFKLVLESLNSGNFDAASHRYRLVQKVAATDPTLARFPVGGGMALAGALARRGKPIEANRLFAEAVGGWRALDADDRHVSVGPLVMMAQAIVEKSVKADRIDLADARYRDMRTALDGYVDEDGSLAPYEGDAIRSLMSANIAKGQLTEARALYDDMHRLTMRYSSPLSEAPAATGPAPVEPDPKPTVTMERSESGSISFAAEWQPSSKSKMGQTLTDLIGNMFSVPLLGHKVNFQPTKKEPPIGLAVDLRKSLAARAIELMRAYGDAEDGDHATEILGDLRELYGEHPEEPPLPLLYGQGTYILWRVYLIEGKLTLAALACEELRVLALAHAGDSPAYMKGFVLAACATIQVWHDSGDPGVAEVARAWNDTLLRTDARAVVTADAGLDAADRFYALLAQHASGAPPAATVS
jgi:hypothetical protein